MASSRNWGRGGRSGARTESAELWRMTHDSPGSYVLLTIAAASAPSQRGAARLQPSGFEPLDLLAVGFDAAPHEEGGSGQEDHSRDQDRLPDLLLVADDKGAGEADHGRAHRAEEGEHKQVQRRHLAAHFVRDDALDSGVLRGGPGETEE